MAIPIEGYSVVARKERIQHLLDCNKVRIPNATALFDDDLWRCSFMTMDDAIGYARSLESLGLNASKGPDSDVVVVNEFDGSIEPYCEWLRTGKWEKAVIAWLTGTEPQTVSAPEGWDPKVGSGLTFRAGKENLEFVRLDENVEVYRDKQTGKEMYIGRTSPPVEALFQTAAKTIRNYLRTVGQPSVTGTDAEQVRRAIAMLETVLAHCPNDWRAHWFHGKGQIALGNASAAYDSFTRAYALETNQEAVARELAGACLELGKFDEAVKLAERAVALHPDNHELVANLALAHLLAGHVEAAQRSIQAAMKLNAIDKINCNLQQAINDVATGRRPIPKTLRDLQRHPQQKKSWQFWKR